LGLKEETGAHINVKLCEEGIETMLAHIEKGTVSTISKCKDDIWSKEAICNTLLVSATPKQVQKEVHIEGLREV
jgi:hypothetical protein